MSQDMPSREFLCIYQLARRAVRPDGMTYLSYNYSKQFKGGQQCVCVCEVQMELHAAHGQAVPAGGTRCGAAAAHHWTLWLAQPLLLVLSILSQSLHKHQL